MRNPRIGTMPTHAEPTKGATCAVPVEGHGVLCGGVAARLITVPRPETFTRASPACATCTDRLVSTRRARLVQRSDRYRVAGTFPVALEPVATVNADSTQARKSRPPRRGPASSS